MSTAMTGLNFDATQVKPDAGGFDPIPGGWYNMKVVGGEVKPTKDGSGLRANIQFQVIDGQYANRRIFNGYNMKNSSPKAEEIGRAQFSSLCHAVGVLNVQDLQQLFNIPLKAKAKLVPPQNGYEAKNEISACKNINEVVEGLSGSAPAMPTMGGMPLMPTAGSFIAPAAPQPWAQPVQQPVAQQPVAQAPVAPQAPVQFAQTQPVAGQQPQYVAPQPTPGANPPWQQPTVDVPASF